VVVGASQLHRLINDLYGQTKLINAHLLRKLRKGDALTGWAGAGGGHPAME
jgi:hypothetical protein